jgi:hypothetical protein
MAKVEIMSPKQNIDFFIGIYSYISGRQSIGIPQS